MASMAMQKLKDQVLGLPEQERAELVDDVIASLDGLADTGVEEAWAEEIVRRVSELESGTVQAAEAVSIRSRLPDWRRGDCDRSCCTPSKTSWLLACSYGHLTSQYGFDRNG